MKIIRRRPRKPGISIFPLIDVVLQLLIFFMLTSKFITHTAHDIELPASKTEDPLKDKEIVVYYTEDGKIFLDESDRAFSPAELDLLAVELERRLQAGDNKVVVLFADHRVLLGDAWQVVDIIKASGASRFTITTTREERP